MWEHVITHVLQKMTHPPGTASEAPSAKSRLPRDHKSWDKFDVEGECAKVEEGEGPVVEGEGSCHAMDGKLSQRGKKYTFVSISVFSTVLTIFIRAQHVSC